MFFFGEGTIVNPETGNRSFDTGIPFNNFESNSSSWYTNLLEATGTSPREIPLILNGLEDPDGVVWGGQTGEGVWDAPAPGLNLRPGEEVIGFDYFQNAVSESFLNLNDTVVTIGDGQNGNIVDSGGISNGVDIYVESGGNMHWELNPNGNYSNNELYFQTENLNDMYLEKWGDHLVIVIIRDGEFTFRIIENYFAVPEANRPPIHIGEGDDIYSYPEVDVPASLSSGLLKWNTDQNIINEDENDDTAHSLFDAGEARGSPLVLDLDDSGTIDLISLENSGAYFDLRESGFAVNTGWVDSADGLLARDLNGDGEINDASELFGSLSTDGFTLLAEHDANGDGIIDDQDAVWSDLLIWQDDNENGYTEDGELHTLDEYDIVSIDLNATEVDQTNEGHDVTHTSTFTVDDGVNPADTLAIHDVLTQPL